MRIATVTISDIEYTAHRLAKELLAFNEPIPDFSSRYPHRLESCLATPFLSFAGSSFYPSLADKASILFYLLIKNYPFQNGNKRIAMTSLLVFLYKNTKWLRVDPEELYQLTVWVAQSPAKSKDGTIHAIRDFISAHLKAVGGKQSAGVRYVVRGTQGTGTQKKGLNG
jgi:death on curing protein